MPGYIDADALIDFLDVGHLRHPSELCFSEVDVANLLLHAPTISLDEVRGVGEWIETAMPSGWYDVTCAECSVCGEDFMLGDYCMDDVRDLFHYCPNCGARMKGAEDGTTE